jgi:hypothetical protein
MLNSQKEEVVNNPVSTEDILELIEVQRPYFALSDFFLDENDWLVAKAPIQCVSDYESPLMKASEVGRHLAILGSCHGALVNPSKTKHYYLASEAVMTSFDAYSSDTSEDYLYARAKSTFINKRQLASETELYNQKGELLAKMQVKYHVLLEEFFLSRFSHASNIQAPKDDNQNPYAKPIELDILALDDNRLESSIGVVKPEMCIGHFDGVRALPVAILAQCTTNASFILLRKKLKNDTAKFVVKECSMTASTLATAGQSVTISTRFIEEEDGLFITRSVAINNKGESIGEIQCKIEAV